MGGREGDGREGRKDRGEASRREGREEGRGGEVR